MKFLTYSNKDLRKTQDQRFRGKKISSNKTIKINVGREFRKEGDFVIREFFAPADDSGKNKKSTPFINTLNKDEVRYVFETINQYDSIGKQQSAVDFIYRYVTTKLLRGSYSVVNQILESSLKIKLKTPYVVSLLNVTKPFAPNLEKRESVMASAKQKVLDTYPYEAARRIIRRFS